MSRRRKTSWGIVGTGCLVLLIVCAIMGWAGERYGEIAAWAVAIFLGAAVAVSAIRGALPARARQRISSSWYRSFSEGRQPIPQSLRDQILKRDDYHCRYCGRRAQTLHIDHVIPVNQGGKTIMSNLVTACSQCNRKKAGRTPSQAAMRVRSI